MNRGSVIKESSTPMSSMYWKVYGRKVPQNLPGKTEKNYSNLSQVNRVPDRDSNRAPLQHEAGLLPNRSDVHSPDSWVILYSTDRTMYHYKPHSYNNPTLRQTHFPQQAFVRYGGRIAKQIFTPLFHSTYVTKLFRRKLHRGCNRSWIKLHNEDLQNYYPPNIITIIK
jgi:hypothetical protein